MNILMAFNENYFFPSLVTISSVLKHVPEQVTFYIMYSQLRDEQKERLEQYAEESGHASVVYILIEPTAFEGLKLLRWISKETYYRLLAQKLLPMSVERFLWLDSDVLVVKNLQDFYYQDFEGKLLVATSVQEENAYHAWYPQITLPADTRYFNAGVLLHDLKAQREVIDANVYEQYVKYFNKQLKLADQDVLNAVFYRCVKYVDFFQYNMFVRYFNFMTPKDRKKCLDQAYILHYNGRTKPWEKNYVQLLGSLYWKYAEELPECEGTYAEIAAEHKKERRKFLKKEKKRTCIRVAEHVFELEHRYPLLGKKCKAYVVSGVKPEARMMITVQHTEQEKKKCAQAAVAEGREIPYYEEPAHEVAAANRLVAQKLLEHDTLLIHGSCVAVDGQAYLFSAKSGTGKSTHTSLWKEHFQERATIINDDKPFLQLRGNQVVAYGAPWCGKEGLNTNTSAPLHAICLIKQGEENKLRQITFEEAFPMLMEQAYRPAEEELRRKTLELIGRLESSVRFYSLECRPDQEAVQVAYDGMKVEQCNR